MLAGKHLTVTHSNERSAELWRSFMPLRKTITTAVSNDLFSVQVYPNGLDISTYHPDAPFEKWAAIEVTGFEQIPSELDTLLLPEGSYAVFSYRGLPAAAQPFINEIFTVWLPQSGYRLDDRPHFAVMGEKYTNSSADSEETFWVPVTKTT